MPPDVSEPGDAEKQRKMEAEETQLAAESEEDLRLKLRHIRTAHKELTRAVERDGLFYSELAEIEDAIEELAKATERALFRKRETQ
jgi:hypothetical protein